MTPIVLVKKARLKNNLGLIETLTKDGPNKLNAIERGILDGRLSLINGNIFELENSLIDLNVKKSRWEYELRNLETLIEIGQIFQDKSPIKPRKGLYVVLGVLVGLFLGIFIVFFNIFIKNLASEIKNKSQ